MNDKDKIIEEMTCSCQCDDGREKIIEPIRKHMLRATNMTEEEAYDFAFRCWQCGYQNIDEDSVVLTREEYEKLLEQRRKARSEMKRFKRKYLYTKLDKDRLSIENERLHEMKLALENQLIQSGLTEYVGADEIEKQARKETAREVIKSVKKMLKGVQECFDGDEGLVGYEQSSVDNGLNKIAKQFNMEINNER